MADSFKIENDGTIISEALKATAVVPAPANSQYIGADSTGKVITMPNPGGGNTFIGLTDTPNDYTNDATLFVTVNSTEDGLEFRALSIDDLDGLIPMHNHIDDNSGGVIYSDGNPQSVEYTGATPGMSQFYSRHDHKHPLATHTHDATEILNLPSTDKIHYRSISASFILAYTDKEIQIINLTGSADIEITLPTLASGQTKAFTIVNNSIAGKVGYALKIIVSGVTIDKIGVGAYNCYYCTAPDVWHKYYNVSIAIGNNAVADTNGIAIGYQAKTGIQSVAIGRESQSLAQNAVAIGYTSSASQAGAIAIGDAETQTQGAIAIGDGATSKSTSGDTYAISGVAVGNDAQTYTGVAVGYLATTSASSVLPSQETTSVDGIAIGKQATGTNSGIAIGSTVSAISTNADSYGTAIGHGAESHNSVAIGYRAKGETTGIAVGYKSLSGNGYSQARGVALGHKSISSSNAAIALGCKATANTTSSIAIGTLAQAQHIQSVAIGANSRTLNPSQMIFNATSPTYDSTNEVNDSNNVNSVGSMWQLYTPTNIPGNGTATDIYIRDTVHFNIAQYNYTMFVIEGHLTALIPESGGIESYYTCILNPCMCLYENNNVSYLSGFGVTEIGSSTTPKIYNPNWYLNLNSAGNAMELKFSHTTSGKTVRAFAALWITFARYI